MRALWAVLCIASLTSGCGDDDDFQTGDGLPTVDARPRPDAPEPIFDAAVADADVELDAMGPSISGTICSLIDIRAAEMCAALELEGVTITMAGIPDREAVTNENGAFNLPAYTDDLDVALIATAPGGEYELAAQQIRLDPDGTASGVKIRMVTKTRFATILEANDITVDPARGHFVVTAKSSSNANITNGVLGMLDDRLPLYDDGDDEIFSPNGTTGARAFGVYFNATPGECNLTLKQGTNTNLLNGNCIVVEDALTFGSVKFE
jgi:hypothetical protein